jgi:hypothetical protein
MNRRERLCFLTGLACGFVVGWLLYSPVMHP